MSSKTNIWTKTLKKLIHKKLPPESTLVLKRNVMPPNLYENYRILGEREERVAVLQKNFIENSKFQFRTQMVIKVY